MKNFIKKVGNVPINAGKGAFRFVDKQMTESLIRSDTRYAYFDQFDNNYLEREHEKVTKKEKDSIKDVMKKRGFKYDYNLKMFYMYSEHRFENTFDGVMKRDSAPKKSYEELEATIREKRESE